MPHLILEYSDNLPRDVAGPDLFRRLHRVLAEAGGIDIGNCKSRSVELDRFLVGDAPEPGSFAHLGVAILEGRPAALKAELGRLLLETVAEAYRAAGARAEVTVEIRDMPRDQYFKASPGTGSP
jgi:5-carboxymethyl-2-hydroxymuconate isomerase